LAETDLNTVVFEFEICYFFERLLSLEQCLDVCLDGGDVFALFCLALGHCGAGNKYFLLDVVSQRCQFRLLLLFQEFYLLFQAMRLVLFLLDLFDSVGQTG
jgi:hypothetical protein